MKPGQAATKLLNELKMEDGEDGWMVQLGANLLEPETIHRWRTMLEKDGSDTSVVSFHILSSSTMSPKKSNDVIVFDRWVEHLGVP